MNPLQLSAARGQDTQLAGDAPPAESFGQPNADTVDPEFQNPTAQKTPWWRRPSPWWLLAAIPFTTTASSAKIAPRIEIYTALVCAVHRPDAAGQEFPTNLLQNFSYLPRLSAPLGSFIGLNTSECASDPVVQAEVAKLIAVVTACTGLLSLLTTGYWGAYSDRHGRARVMGISLIGLLLDDLNFILVTNFPRLVPGGYWFFVVGATFDGWLGGFTTGVAALHTYLTDTTDEHDRSRILSLNIGLLFIGMAVGPTLGSFLIRATGQALSVFYGAVICTLLYSVLIWFILPESVTEQQMTRARAKYNDDLRKAAERQRASAAAFLPKIRWATSFLSPLTIFLPVSYKSPNNVANPGGRDWSLTLLALAYGCTISIMGSYQNKLQYAASEFGWSTEMIGYWLSLIGATRALVMVLILPVTIKFLKQKILNRTSPTDLNSSELTPLLEDDSQPGSPIRGAKFMNKIDSAWFDLCLAKFSLVVDIMTSLGMAVAQTGRQFTVAGVFGAFGLGFNPAMQSVTLALYAGRGGTEAGRLFGALSVIQAFGTQILGPTLYSFVYARTVATFPRAILFVSVVAVIISFILLLMVRLPSDLAYQDTEDPVREISPSGTHIASDD